MGNTFKPFSFYGEVKDISCDSFTLDIMVGEEFKKYDLGMYDDKVAIQSETGEVIVVCDTIK